MKETRLFLATGAIVLAGSAIFATKANKMFTDSIKTGYSQLGPIALSFKTIGGNAWLTANNTGHPAIVTILSAGGHIAFWTQLFTSGGKRPLYYW